MRFIHFLLYVLLGCVVHKKNSGALAAAVSDQNGLPRNTGLRGRMPPADTVHERRSLRDVNPDDEERVLDQFTSSFIKPIAKLFDVKGRKSKALEAKKAKELLTGDNVLQKLYEAGYSASSLRRALGVPKKYTQKNFDKLSLSAQKALLQRLYKNGQHLMIDYILYLHKYEAKLSQIEAEAKAVPNNVEPAVVQP